MLTDHSTKSLYINIMFQMEAIWNQPQSFSKQKTSNDQLIVKMESWRVIRNLEQKKMFILWPLSQLKTQFGLMPVNGEQLLTNQLTRVLVFPVSTITICLCDLKYPQIIYNHSCYPTKDSKVESHKYMRIRGQLLSQMFSLRQCFQRLSLFYNTKSLSEVNK